MKELDKQYEHYVGVDESGRGNVMGSMFFVGCKLKSGVDIEQISFADDSKKISEKKREEMYNQLKDLVDYKIVRTTAQDIDSFTLANCLKASIESIKNWAKETPIIYDGNTNYKVSGVETMIKADAKISLVSAASIIAKYMKDKESYALHEKYPEFSCHKHKGYINKKHTQEILENGYTKHHRKSYNINALVGKDLPIYNEPTDPTEPTE